MTALLPATLALAVPVYIARLQAQGGPTQADRDSVLGLPGLLAERGDVLLYGGAAGEPATVFNELARGLAVLAFAPGGVRAFGLEWIAE